MDARRKTYESAIPYIVGAAVFLFVLLALNMPPWWPYERIIIAGSPEPLVARVVGLDGGDTVILMDGRLSRITSTSIISREICAKGEDGFGTLFTGLDQRAVIGALGTQDYPDCPRP